VKGAAGVWLGARKEDKREKHIHSIVEPLKKWVANFALFG